MHHVRGHWQVENSLHFVKDRWWDEDRHYTRRPGVAEWLAMLTNLALTVLYRYQRQVPGYPVRACADRIAWNPLVGLKLLGLAN